MGRFEPGDKINLKMATTAKAERDEAQTNLMLTLRRLDGLTKENQLVVSMGRAQKQYEEAIKKHIAFCAKKGEDPSMGAHMEWSFALGDLYSKSYDRAEEKLEVFRAASEPAEISDTLKLASAKTEWAVAECQIKSDVDGLITALEPQKIGLESHKSLEEARDRLVKDLDAIKTQGTKIVELAVRTNVPEEEVTALINGYENLRKSIAPKIAQINSNLIIKKPDLVGVEQTGQSSGVILVPVSRSSLAGTREGKGEPRKQFIKYQPQEMPKFSGKAKDFARWKNLWQEGISPQFAESAQMMAFQTCLPEDVWKKIGRLEGISRVWD